MLGDGYQFKAAEGDILQEALFDSDTGWFGTKYLSGAPLKDRLSNEEQIHFLLVNSSSGLTISRVNDQTTDRTPDKPYHALAAITDRRILYVLGQENGDQEIELRAAEIMQATLSKGFLKKTLVVHTEGGEYKFRIKQRKSSDATAVLTFIENQLAPQTVPSVPEDDVPPESAQNVSPRSTTDQSTPAEPTLDGKSRVMPTDGGSPKGDSSDSSTDISPTKHELVEEYVRISQEVGQRPRKDRFLQGTQYTEAAILDVFGSWENAYNNVFNELDIRAKLDSKQSDQASEHATSTVAKTTQKPTRDQLTAGIEAVTKDLGKRPTTTEFDEHSDQFTTEDAYEVFGSWGKATNAASFDEITRDALLEDIHRLVQKRGYVPVETHIKEHCRFTPYDYQDEFGNVSEAVAEAGYELQPSVKKALEEVAKTVSGRPSTTDFDEHSPYNPGSVYKFYDTWGEATDDISFPETSTDADSASDGDTEIEQTTAQSSERTPLPNELAERYETIWNLDQLLLAIEDFIVEVDGVLASEDPMQEWIGEVQSFFMDPGYGEQQRERNDFTMDEYREAYGDGEHVLEFHTIDAEPPSQALQVLLNAHYEGDIGSLYLPVNQKTGRRFPVLVETPAELEDARAMLELLPNRPSTSGSKSTSTTTTENDSEDESDTATEEPEQPETAADESTSSSPTADTETEGTTNGLAELHDIPVITEEMAKALHDAGFHDPAALAEASDDELANVDGISEQIAMRIVLAVTND
jgi:predicted flap endonuclease-1-like 5' DNA nuclease